MSERNKEDGDITEFLKKKAPEYEDTPENPPTKVKDMSQEGLSASSGLPRPNIATTRPKPRPQLKEGPDVAEFVSRLRYGSLRASRRAVDALVAKGPRVAGIMVPLLSDRDREVAQMAASVLSRLDWKPGNAAVERAFNAALHGWRIPASSPPSTVLRGTDSLQVKQEQGMFRRVAKRKRKKRRSKPFRVPRFIGPVRPEEHVVHKGKTGKAEWVNTTGKLDAPEPEEADPDSAKNEPSKYEVYEDFVHDDS